MIRREIETEVINISKQYPVTIITGPRQSGKTTLARACFPDKKYVNLEDPAQRRVASYDLNGFIENLKEGAVIDEIQRVPELISSIQVEVDRKRVNRRFILTGSNQFSLIESVTQSLAGRAAFLKLLPFTLKEASEYNLSLSADEQILTGFYPAIYENSLEPYKAYLNYYETYIERDLRQLINIKDMNKFQLFMRLCAGRTGQIFNASNLANETGVSLPTIQNWVSILETSFVVFFLQPWHSNIGKRLIKSPKLYFTDVGLASYLLGNENAKHISTHPVRGHLFENMIVSELLKHRYNAGLDNNLFFYRDNHQNEVDIIARRGSKLNVYEIKASQTFHSDFMKGIDYIGRLLPEIVGDKMVIYGGGDEFSVGSVRVIGFRDLPYLLSSSAY